MDTMRSFGIIVGAFVFWTRPAMVPSRVDTRHNRLLLLRRSAADGMERMITPIGNPVDEFVPKFRAKERDRLYGCANGMIYYDPSDDKDIWNHKVVGCDAELMEKLRAVCREHYRSKSVDSVGDFKVGDLVWSKENGLSGKIVMPICKGDTVAWVDVGLDNVAIPLGDLEHVLGDDGK